MNARATIGFLSTNNLVHPEILVFILFKIPNLFSTKWSLSQPIEVSASRYVQESYVPQLHDSHHIIKLIKHLSTLTD